MKDNRLKQFFRILDEVDAYARIGGKVGFDMQCCAPPEGMERAGEDMAVLGQQIHKLTHSKKYVSLLNSLHEDPGDATPVQRRTIQLLWENWAKTKNQTAQYAFSRDTALTRAYGAWLQAKQKADFSLFRNSLKDVVDYTRSDIDLRDEKKSTYYNSCLDDFEKGEG